MENILSQSFYLLNDDNTPLQYRLKLARSLWIKKTNLPNKELSLINWTVSVTSCQNVSCTDRELLLKTLADFLSSSQLRHFLHNRSQKVVLKSNFIKNYIDAINLDKTESILNLLEIGKCLLRNEKIVNDVATKFEIFLSFFSEWISLLKKDSSESWCGNEIEEIKTFGVELFQRLNKVLASHNNPIKAFTQFVNGAMDVIFNIYNDLSKETDDTLYLLSQQAIKEGLFLRKREFYFETNSKNNENVQLLLKHVNKMEITAKVITYGLFMDSYKDAPSIAIFDFFSNLISDFEIKDFFSDNEMEVLALLLKINLESKLYQPGLNQTSAEIQLCKYKQLIAKLLHKSGVCTENWVKCISTIASISTSCIESELGQIFCHVFNLSIDESEVLWIEHFFSDLAFIFNQIRKPLELLNAMLNSLNKNSEQNLYTPCSLFAEALSNQCASVCSPNTCLDIFSTVQQYIFKILEKSCIKTSHKTIANLVTILRIVIENSFVIEFSSQVLVMHRFQELLQGQLSMIRTLFKDFSEHSLLVTGPIIELQTIHSYCLLILNTYSYQDQNSSPKQAIDIWSMEDWDTISNLCHSTECSLLKEEDSTKRQNLSYNDLFLWRKWQCFEMERLFMKFCDSDLTNDQVCKHPSTQQLANNFINNVCSQSNYSNVIKNKFHKHIDSKEMLTSQSLFLLQSNFDIIVDGCDNESLRKLVEFLLKGFLNQTENEISIFGNILLSSNFLENKKLNYLCCNLLPELSLQNAKVNVNKDIRCKIICQYTKGDDDLEKLLSKTKSIFKNHHNPVFPSYLHVRLNSLLSVLPMKTSDKKINIFLLASLIFKETEIFSEKLKAIKVSWKLTDNMQDSNFFSLLNGELFSYILEGFANFSEELQQIIVNFLGNIIKVCFLNENFKKNLEKVCSKSMGVKDNDLMTVTSQLLLETLSKIVLTNKGNKFYAIQKILEFKKGQKVIFKLNKHISKNVAVDDIQFDKSKSANYIEPLIRSLLSKAIISASGSKNDVSLLRSCLLSSIALDSLQQPIQFENFKSLNKKNHLDNIIQEKIKLLKNVKDFNSMELVLLYSEVQIAMFHCLKDEDESHNLLDVEDLIECCDSNNERYYFMWKNIMFIQMCMSSEKLTDVFNTTYVDLQEGKDENKLISTLKFVQFCCDLYQVKSRKFKNLSVDQTELNFAQINYLRNALDLCAEMLTKLFSNSLVKSQKLNNVLIENLLCTMTAILSKGPAIARTRQLYIVISSLLCMNFEQAHEVLVVSPVYDVMMEILFHHKDAIKNLVPLISAILHKFLKCSLLVGNIQLKIDKVVPQNFNFLERLCQYIAEHFGPYFAKTVSYIIADYVHGISSSLLNPIIKSSLEFGIFHLLTLCDEHAIYMLHATLPLRERDVFHQVHQKFKKYFKYKGVV